MRSSTVPRAVMTRMGRVLPARRTRFAELTEACREPAAERFALAELSGWLGELSSGELREAVTLPPAPAATPYLANYVAAMIEYACARRHISPPPWTREITPLGVVPSEQGGDGVVTGRAQRQLLPGH